MHPTKGDQMSDHFIKNIEIKNFKCFEDFKAEGFGRVNLIGGKNNVGKTAFMEACWVHAYGKSSDKMAVALSTITTKRNILEYFEKVMTKEDFQNNLEKNENFYAKSNLHLTIFHVKKEDSEKKYQFVFLNHNVNINTNKFNFDIKSSDIMYFISSFGLSNRALKRVYEAVQIQDREEELYNLINKFDINILNFKIIGGDKPQCKIKNGEYRDINEFGDGLKHYISIICSLYAYKDGYLFIDELDNGIHYTQLDKLWEIILTISKEQNVQVFATTHSKEAIESYARVAKRLKDEEITYTILTKLEDNSIDAGVYSASMLINTIDQEHEVRGW